MLTAGPVTRTTPPASAAGVVHRQLWMGPRDRPLCGWLSLPPGGDSRGAVLLCPAIGDESRATRRTFRTLATRLARLGFVALRIDVDGTGDSAGEYADPDPARRWLDAVAAAAEHLRGLGHERIDAVGMRLGATLLADLAANGRVGLGSLVLWDPAAGGNAFLREGEALYAFGERPTAPTDGLRHTPGYQYDEDAAASLRTLDLGRLPIEPLAERVLLLTRADRPLLRRARRRLAAEGERLHELEALGQELLLDTPPSESVVPEQSLGAVVDWLDHEPARPSVPVAAPEQRPAQLTWTATDGSVRDVREHSRLFAGGHVYGMVTEPAEPGAAGPWVVLVNVATTDHTGPGRAWVRLARQWAADGYRCVRIDLSGVGESPARPGHGEDVLYDPAWLRDGRELVAELGEGGLRVCLVGICSGSYSALEAAAHGGVDAVVAINPALTLYAAARGQRVFTRERRVARVPWGVLGRLAVNRRAVAGGIWRVYRQIAFWQAPMWPLLRIARAGTTVLAMGCRHDMRQYAEVALVRLLGSRGARGRLSLVFDDDLDHPVLTRAGQLSAERRTTAFLHERYPR